MVKPGYSINSLYKTSSIIFDIGPWWAFLIRWLIHKLYDLITYKEKSIPIPNIRFKPKGEKEFTTTKEWFGDFSQLFFSIIYIPIINFIEKYLIKTSLINVDYNDLKNIFYKKDKEFWDENINLAKEIEDDN